MSTEHEPPQNPDKKMNPIWFHNDPPDQINPEALPAETASPRVFIEWVAILEKAKCMGNPCDFVMEYRKLLHDYKKTGTPEEVLGHWVNFWGFILLAVEVATGRQSVTGNPWRLRFQSAVTPKTEALEHRISMVAEKARSAIRTTAAFPYADMASPPIHTPPTPEARMVVLAHWFCVNFQQDPQLILRADRMELATLRAAALEFSCARPKSL